MTGPVCMMKTSNHVFIMHTYIDMVCVREGYYYIGHYSSMPENTVLYYKLLERQPSQSVWWRLNKFHSAEDSSVKYMEEGEDQSAYESPWDLRQFKAGGGNHKEWAEMSKLFSPTVLHVSSAAYLSISKYFQATWLPF